MDRDERFGDKKVAIIGAGLAGIGAAQLLRSSGFSVTVFEKSRGYGGRCATKRWEGQIIDHGAQYFTVRHDSFRKALRAAKADLREIAAPILTERGEALPVEPRYYHVEGNSRVVRALATDLDVRTGVTVERPERLGDGRWFIGGGMFDHVISTAPLPQTFEISGASPDVSVTYVPCLAALFLYRGDWAGKSREQYAISDQSGDPLEWSACENHKAGRIQSGFTAMVVHASRDFSEKFLERDPEHWLRDLRGRLEERWQLPSQTLAASHPHRWRYARIESPIGDVSLPGDWHFAGDAVLGSRVESAWFSGYRVAAKLVASLVESEE